MSFPRDKFEYRMRDVGTVDEWLSAFENIWNEAHEEYVNELREEVHGWTAEKHGVTIFAKGRFFALLDEPKMYAVSSKDGAGIKTDWFEDRRKEVQRGVAYETVQIYDYRIEEYLKVWRKPSGSDYEWRIDPRIKDRRTPSVTGSG